WGSSLMKDSIVIGFVGLLTYAIYKVFFQQRNLFLGFIMAVFSVYILFNVKQYVIIAYAPALILWMSLVPLSRLPRRQRWMVMPFLLTIAIAIIALLFPVLEQASQKYALDQVLTTAEQTAEYIHRTTREGGSSYSLGE